MSIPQIAIINSFDATLDYVVTFKYSGNQVFGNDIQIYNNLTNDLIYSNTVTSFQLQHLIPANALTNSGSWYVKIRVFDKDSIYSNWSNPIVFATHLTPTIAVDILSNQIVRNSYLPVTVTYTSADNELLNTWKLILYDSGQNQISVTDSILAINSMGTTIQGLETSTQYYLEVTGVTVNQMIITTGKIEFSVDYEQPSAFTTVELINNSEDGTVKIASHLISIDGKSQPSPPSYINNEEVDLTTSNSSVWFDEGFNITGDCTKQILIRNLTPYSICYVNTNGVDTINIKYLKATFDNGEKCYFLLEIKNSIITYRIATEPMDILESNQYVYLLFRRVNDLYSIKSTLKN